MKRRLDQEPQPHANSRPLDPDSTVPCKQCGPATGVRQFSFNPPPAAVIDDASRPVLASDVVFTVLSDTMVLYRPSKAASLVLNTSAAQVVAEIDDERTVAEVIDALHTATGVDRAVLATDVTEAIGRFQAAGIVLLDDDVDLAASTGPATTPVTRWTAVTQRILDERPWPLMIGPVRAAGLDLVVRTDAVDAIDDLRTALGALPPAPAATAGDAPVAPHAAPTVVSLLDQGPGRARRLRLYVDGRRQWSVGRPDGIGARVMTEINRLAIERSRGRLRLHAGAVERDGRVVVIAGDSGRGKSTLTAALVQRGFAYLTDELTAIDPLTLAALPYPKALDLDASSHAHLGLDLPSDGGGDVDTAGADKRPVAPERLGRISAGGQLALVVLLDGGVAPAAPTSPPSPSPDAMAVVDLLGVTFGPSFEDETVLDTLARIATSVAILRVPRLPLTDACDRIEAELRET